MGPAWAQTARALAADGFKVGILSSSGKGEALAKELGGVGITGTNKSEADPQKLVDAAMDQWGRIDVLVNSAGHGPRAPVCELEGRADRIASVVGSLSNRLREMSYTTCELSVHQGLGLANTGGFGVKLTGCSDFSDGCRHQSLLIGTLI